MHASFITLGSLLIASLLFAGCAESTTEEAASAAVDDGADVGSTNATSDLEAGESTLSFTSSWTVTQSKTLRAGGKAKVVYDGARVTECGGEFQGQPAWSQTGSFQVGGGAVSTFTAAGFSPSQTPVPATITLPPAVVRGEGETTSDLSMWFETSNRWGCHAYDSNFGANYHFAVEPPANGPQWLGVPRVVMSRATCNDGRACEADRRVLDKGFVYDTWAAQRAAIRQLSFEVYREGVTDRADPDLWQKLDVRAYTRVGKSGAYRMQHLPFDARVGNNARYTLELRGLQPFAGNTITQTTDCPAFAFRRTASGLVEADVEIYFWINGVELRAKDGSPFVGTFQDYEGLYKLCK